MSLGDRTSFGLLGLLMTLLGFVACSEHDSASGASDSGSSHSTAGTPGVGGASADLGGQSSVGQAGAPSAGSMPGQGGVASNAGMGGASSAGTPSAGLGGISGVVAAGSGGALAGGAGSGNAGHGGSSSGAGGASAAFRQVSAIFGSNCGLKGCHADKQSPHFANDAMLYATLTAGTVLAECDYNKMIEPGDPSKSALVQLMNRKCGSFTMPPSCNKTTCLSAADLQTLTDWVQAGAAP